MSQRKFPACLPVVLAVLIFGQALYGQEPAPENGAPGNTASDNEAVAPDSPDTAVKEPDAPEANTPVAGAAGMDLATLSAIVEKLSPDHRKQFGQMLSADWRDRPEWADMLIALLQGEELRPGAGWFKLSQKRYDWSWLSAKFDANADGPVTKDELPVGTPNLDQVFSRLDRDNDGQLRLADFDYSGRQPSTPPQMMSQFLGALLDGDSNGRITPEELTEFLKRADRDKLGFLTGEDLYRDFTLAFDDLNGSEDDMPPPDKMLAMFFRGELGTFGAGPNLGDAAPDFTLPTHDGSRSVTLSQCRGKPVILIFGSFT